MNRNLSLFAFIVGLLAVVWVAIGYIGGSSLALAMSCLIAAVYVAGALEMRRFHLDTAALSKALGSIPDDIGHLGEWLQQVPAALKNIVRLRVEGERVALPGPGVTPYLIGLLVLLGMLGTFLGMVVTLNGAVLALESTTDLQTIRAALAAPVKGLGVAFGTSIAGVATSAMLGLVSTLCRRDRQQVGQLLDSRIAGVLREFSLSHQRQETFKALQAQAQALPDLVGKLDGMMTQMAEHSRQLGEQLLAGQQRFHDEAKGLYGSLAESVDQSLKNSLRDSAKVAAEAIQPVVTATMAGIAGETRGLHDRLLATVDSQVAGIAGRFAQTATTVGDSWTQALIRHEQATDSQHRQLQTALAAYAETFDQGAAALLTSVDSSQARLRSDAAQQFALLVETAGASQQQLALTLSGEFDRVASRLDQAVNQLAATFGERSEALLASVDSGHATLARSTALQQAAAIEQGANQLDEIARLSANLLADVRATQAASQAAWAASEQARHACFSDTLGAMADRLEAQWQQAGQATLAHQEQITHTLGDTARDLVAATRQQAETTISEVSRLMQTAAEAPRAAAEVIGQLRHELSASMAHDNSLLEERSRIMATLATLLDAINHASTEQRGAVDGLIASSTGLLERVAGQFVAKVESEAGKLVEIGAGMAGGALEVASLGEAFGQAVQLFSASNDKMSAVLQRIEGGLAKSLSRSDEQLAYYVAQAREIIDLSILSQKKMVDDLQRAALLSHNSGGA